MNAKLKTVKGEFIRTESSFRNWITKDGGVGETGKNSFKAEPNRYHLYVSYACPWAHRTLIFRALKGLTDVISVSVVHPLMPAQSWVFGEYPNLWAYTRELYQVPGIAETVNMDHIKYHYFASHHSINPTGIVPNGPEIDFLQAHGREYLSYNLLPS